MGNDDHIRSQGLNFQGPAEAKIVIFALSTSAKKIEFACVVEKCTTSRFTNRALFGMEAPEALALIIR